MRLNVGCGDKPMPGYLNIDALALPGADLVHDLRRGLPFGEGTVTEIYAKHLVEHFTPREWAGILADWVRVLMPGSGRLVIECPDLRRCCEKFVGDRVEMRPWWHHTIYGAEETPHRQGFDLKRLRADLEAAGLTVTRIRSWHDDVNVDDPTLYYNLRAEAVRA